MAVTPPNVVMTQYVVYKNASDQPNWKYVVRRWFIVEGQQEPVREDHLWARASTELGLRHLQKKFEDMRLICLPRWPADDPAILEVWI